MENIHFLPESIINGMLTETKISELGLWQIVSSAQREFNTNDPHEIRLVAFDAVLKLLEHDNVAVVSYHPEEKAYEVWGTEPSVVIPRLETEWAKLGRIPDLAGFGGIYFIDKAKLPLLKTISSP